jgi:predicted polyphosphate/ATP-dependent NAD kinase
MNLRIGLLLNPFAGIGGPLALKGSDGDELVHLALAQGAELKAPQRLQQCLQLLLPYKEQISWYSAPDSMGELCLREAGFSPTVIGALPNKNTNAQDTFNQALKICAQTIDLLLFVGGDGTARIIFDAVGSEQLVLGIPAGVKMHSGVFAVSPQAAARLLQQFLNAKPVSVSCQEVRDIDEQQLRAGKINSRYYGELLVPNDNRYVQQVKNSGELDDAAMQLDIAAGIVDELDNETIYIVGAGTTPQAVMNELGLPNTLLGVDVVLGRQLIATNVTANALLALVDTHPYHPVKIIITATGNQGYIIGRGNQQLSPSLLQKVGKENILLLVTPNKLANFSGRPLLIDSGDPDLDAQWAGWIKVIAGYRQELVYPLSCGME